MFETIKSWVISILVLVLLAGLGYWAFTSLESGSEHVVNQEIKDLENENKDLKKQVASLEEELALYKPAEPVAEDTKDNPEPEKPAEPTVYKQQKLIDELAKLITDNINMKVGSRGTRVGTVQNFLNLYNNTSSKVDNAYGEGTKKAITAFQKAVGLNADGNAGPSTYQKMIDWLKTQG